ncbi:hypothetical protein N9A86_01615 [Akkermansiaceae bacterium]|nr:hypothetical protein [Akkermansiaceae bacterium]
MDNSLKELESQLETLIPRGLSNEGEASCSALIDQLAAGEIDNLSSSHSGLTWRASAAAVALGVGMGSGWWMGRETSIQEAVISEPVSVEYLAGFDVIEHPVEVVSEGIAKIYIDEAGEVREVWNEIEVEKETIRPVGTNYVITWSKRDRHEVEVIKSQF